MASHVYCLLYPGLEILYKTLPITLSPITVLAVHWAVCLSPYILSLFFDATNLLCFDVICLYVTAACYMQISIKYSYSYQCFLCVSPDLSAVIDPENSLPITLPGNLEQVTCQFYFHACIISV